MLIAVLSVVGSAAASPVAAHAQDVQWLYRNCVNYSSNDARAFCLTYIGGVADLVDKNCQVVKQRLSAGGLSNVNIFGGTAEKVREVWP